MVQTSKQVNAAETATQTEIQSDLPDEPSKAEEDHHYKNILKVKEIVEGIPLKVLASSQNEIDRRHTKFIKKFKDKIVQL